MSVMQILDGPRFGPTEPGEARRLVVLIHGYGANGRDLIGLAPAWAEGLGDAMFIAPDAPEPVPGVPGGRQWFPITQLDPRLLAEGLRQASPSLERLVERETARLGLAREAVAIMGFSQGAMLALDMAVRRPELCACVLGYSGALLTPPQAAGADLPPFFLRHGDADQTVPPDALLAAVDQLGAVGARMAWALEAGLGHGISEAGVMEGARFLTDAFAGRHRNWRAPQPMAPAR